MAFELDDLFLAGVGAGRLDRVHIRLGAGAFKADTLGAGNDVDQLFAKTRQRLRGRGVMRTKRQLRRHGIVEFFVRVAKDHRAEAAHVVDIHIAVDVIKARALGVVDEDRIFLIG